MEHSTRLMGATQATVIAERLNADEAETWTYTVVEVGTKGLCRIDVYDEDGEYIGVF